MGIRVTDLMVGDWVLDTRTNNPLRVNPFLAELEVPEWQPIPLTEEILEKNIDDTLEENKFYRIHQIGGLNESVEITACDTSIWWTINGDEYEIKELKYVHELQHLLKLCGINKEIVL